MYPHDRDRFWTLTPREFDMEMKAAEARINFDYDQSIRVAYINEVFRRTEKLSGKTLDQFLTPKRKATGSSQDEKRKGLTAKEQLVGFLNYDLRMGHDR